jgi:hypothetical protein
MNYFSDNKQFFSASGGSLRYICSAIDSPTRQVSDSITLFAAFITATILVKPEKSTLIIPHFSVPSWFGTMNIIAAISV